MVDLMNLLSDVLIGSFQMLMLNDLGKNMFPYRIKTCWTRILIYGVTALVILGVNHIESTFINIMMVPVSYTIASIVIFQGSVWKKIILTCCYYMLAIVPEFLFAVITGAYGVTGTENNFHSELEKLLSLLLMSTITFLLVKCVNQITRKKNYQTIENKLFTVLLTLPAATIIIFMCIYYSQISYTGVNRIMIPIGAALLLMTNICIFAVFDKLIEKSEEVKKMELLYQKSKAENINQKYINKVNEDKRVFLHDVNKFLCTAASLIENGKNLELDSMVRHLGIRMEELKNYSYCADPVLNSILCERKFVAESKGILYKIKLGNNLRTDFIEDLDLISIVGNLLDNAIEAAEKTEKDQHVICNMYMGNAYLLTLARWSEEPQFTINVTLSSRPYTVRDIEKVVGDFTTNILFDFSASDMKGTIAEQLKFIRNKLYEYCDHSSYEGVEIIRDMIKTGKISQEKPLPIVFTSMLFGNLPNLSEMDVVYSQSQTSQVSLDNQTYKLEDGGLIVWDFIKKIYPETMVEEMFSYYCMVIEQLSKNDGELKCSPAFEKKIKLYNSTEKEIDFFNLGKRLDNIFYKFADKIAITDFEGGITYRELERNIKSTMHDLKKNGIKPGKYVVIKTDKSKESIITILAVVLAGATYVPVEKHWPVERVQYILDNAGADMIIDPYEVCSSNEVNDSWKNIDVESSTYVIYTSGSTGKPKGVEIAYKSMVNTVLDINDRIGLNSSDTILGLSSLCFDLSVYDLFATFFTGAQLKLVKELRDTEDIKKLVDSSSDIVWNSVPAAMELFIDSLDEDYKNDEMKAVLLSGDWINVNLPDKIKKHFPKAAIFSLGGATEASIWSIYYPIKKVDASWTSIPYGYPLTNQSIYILDSEQRICPPEVIGEIYIGGIGVAKGYINDEEKTSNSFVKSKYGRLYRTGDFGKYSREGYVIFCGRRDSQVKIGGYRIELEEIEAQIKEVPNIKDCIAVVNYKNQIVVFYKGEELDIAEIKRAIRKKLPTYMYPHRYYRVDDFPLNTNEKIDRKMLKSMADSGIQNKMHNEKQDDLRNPSLNKVIEIWSEVLNCDVEPENDFFELGGDSIKAQRIVRKIADNFKVKISFLTVIHSKNVAEFR